MKYLIKHSLEDGSSVLIEAEGAEVEGEMTRVLHSSTSCETVDIENQTFEESLGIVKPVQILY